MTDVVVPTQLDYKKYPTIKPKYKLSRLIQQTGGQTVTLNTAGGQESIFEIPVKVINLACSKIQLQLQIAAGGAGFSNYIFGNCIPFWQQVQLYNRGGQLIVDLYQAQNHTNLVTLPETKFEELKTMDRYAAGLTGNIPPSTATNPVGQGQVFQTANNEMFIFNGSIAYAATNTSPVPGIVNYTNVRHNHDSTQAANTFTTSSFTDVKYDEVRYFTVGGANAATYVNFTLPLSVFKNTLLAVDKDLYFNEVMLLRLVWNPVARVAFTSGAPLAAITAQNNPIVYIAGVPSPADTTNVPKAAAATSINNLQMLLAIEENSMIANDIKTKVLSPGGLSLLTPFVYTSKISLNAATLQTITLRYN